MTFNFLLWSIWNRNPLWNRLQVKGFLLYRYIVLYIIKIMPINWCQAHARIYNKNCNVIGQAMKRISDCMTECTAVTIQINVTCTTPFSNHLTGQHEMIKNNNKNNWKKKSRKISNIIIIHDSFNRQQQKGEQKVQNTPIYENTHVNIRFKKDGALLISKEYKYCS